MAPRPRSTPPTKRRKILMGKAPAEILFDTAAREDYLTGFHKRKVARVKQAQELAKQAEKEEKKVHRREIREERKKELEEHVLAVKRAMEAANGIIENPAGIDSSDDEEDTNKEWTGFEDTPTDSRQDAEYIDEDQYATVTVESVDISKDGFVVQNEEESEEEDVDNVVAAAVANVTAEASKLSGEGKKRVWTKDKPLGLRRPSKKKREKKFRYESKTERKVNRDKQRVKNRAQAQVRKEKAGK